MNNKKDLKDYVDLDEQDELSSDLNDNLENNFNLNSSNSNTSSNNLKKQHTLDFYSDEMSKKAVKSIFPINNENSDNLNDNSFVNNDIIKVNRQPESYNTNLQHTNTIDQETPEHNNLKEPARAEKPRIILPTQVDDIQEESNIQPNVKNDYDYHEDVGYNKIPPENTTADKGAKDYKYGSTSSHKKHNFRDTSFSIEKINAEKEAREALKANKQILKDLEKRETPKMRKSPRPGDKIQSYSKKDQKNDENQQNQFRSIRDVQNTFSGTPVNINTQKTNVNKKRKEIMLIRICTTSFIIIILIGLFINIFSNSKLKSQISELQQTNEALVKENEQVQTLKNQVDILSKEIDRLEPGASSIINNIDSTGSKQYTVSEGDTLSSISKKFYGDESRYNDIVEANNLTSQELVVGQTLLIP